MINFVRVTNHLGETLTLELRSPEKSGFFIQEIEGLGPTKSIINITESINVHGGVFNSARSSTRNIVFKLGFFNDGSDSIETIRQRTYRFFPVNRQVTVEVETDNRLAYAVGYVESNEPVIFTQSSDTVISILCPNAFFTDKNVTQTVFSGVNGGFTFPFENASLTEKLLQFGNVFIDSQKSVLYTGDEPTGVVIYVSFLGTVTYPTIYNLTTNETFFIDTGKIAAIAGAPDFLVGDELIISTLRGNKFVYLIRNGVVYNILNAMGSDSSWFQIDRGDNLFAYSASSGEDNMQFLIEHHILYGGI